MSSELADQGFSPTPFFLASSLSSASPNKSSLSYYTTTFIHFYRLWHFCFISSFVNHDFALTNAITTVSIARPFHICSTPWVLMCVLSLKSGPLFLVRLLLRLRNRYIQRTKEAYQVDDPLPPPPQNRSELKVTLLLLGIPSRRSTTAPRPIFV